MSRTAFERNNKVRNNSLGTSLPTWQLSSRVPLELWVLPRPTDWVLLGNSQDFSFVTIAYITCCLEIRQECNHLRGAPAKDGSVLNPHGGAFLHVVEFFCDIIVLPRKLPGRSTATVVYDTCKYCSHWSNDDWSMNVRRLIETVIRIHFVSLTW